MRKSKTIGILGILSLVIVIPLLLISKLIAPDTHYKTVKISGTTVKAEVADTALKRAEGLMSKSYLPKDNGMLFIFTDEAHHKIWMMNMSFPIDIIWIGKDLKVVDIAEDAQPCKINCPIYAPDEKSLYVLEVNSGFAKENKLKIGDSVLIS